MAPVRSKKRSSTHLMPVPGGHAQHLLSPSDIDLELDVDFYPDSEYPMAAQALPKPPLRTNEELNLQVLQRLDRQITGIMSLATYSVIYTFSTVTQGWEKSNIEGTMFVVQLAQQQAHAQTAEDQVERYAVFVLNRRGLENFVMELRSEEDIEVTSEYIIFQQTQETGTSSGVQTSVIYGLWIFAEPMTSTAEARTFNARVIQHCAAQANSSRTRTKTRQMHLEAEEQKEKARIAEEQERERLRLSEERERKRVAEEAEWQAQQSQLAMERLNIERDNAAVATATARKTELLDLFKRPTQPPLVQATSTPVNLLNLFKNSTREQVPDTPISHPDSAFQKIQSNYGYENIPKPPDQYYPPMQNNGGQMPHVLPQHYQPIMQQHPLAYGNTNHQHQQPQQYYRQAPPQHTYQHNSSYPPPQQYPPVQQSPSLPMHMYNQNQGFPNQHGYPANTYRPSPPGFNYPPGPGQTHGMPPPGLGQMPFPGRQ